MALDAPIFIFLLHFFTRQFEVNLIFAVCYLAEAMVSRLVSQQVVVELLVAIEVSMVPLASQWLWAKNFPFNSCFLKNFDGQTLRQQNRS